MTNALLFVALFMTLLPQAFAERLPSIAANGEAVSDLKGERFSAAYRKLTKALEKEPRSAILHYNLGLALAGNKEFEKSIEEFQAAKKLAPDSKDLSFFADFNSGLAATEAKNVDLALKYYQAALDVHPDSVETKVNIENLIQQQNGGGEGGEGKPKEDPNGDGKNSPKFTNEQNKNEPQPYKGKELTAEDVQKILDELKAQENRVRAKYQRDGKRDNKKSDAKDSAGDKDW